MNQSELSQRISDGEDSYTQFKVQAVSSKDLAKEFVAFSNAEGGILLFGVRDDGEIKGLSSDEVEALGQLVGNVANENVKPPIHPLIQIISIEDKKVLVVSIANGMSKPYSTASGDYGADKKKISQEELRRLFAESKRLFADEEKVYETDISDINMQLYYIYLEKANKGIFDKLKKGTLNLDILLENEMIMKEDNLTLAGNLIFGMNPQKFNKLFYINCCYFDGNDTSATHYISKKRILGTIEKLYDDSMSFVTSNLRYKQVEENFNSNGILEIDERVLGELIVNALIHRDYYINSSIKIFIFHNRVEIISPGKLTNSLTIENIKNGRSICRNPILDSICENILTYSGYGSGIKRVLPTEALNNRKIFKMILKITMI